VKEMDQRRKALKRQVHQLQAQRSRSEAERPELRKRLEQCNADKSRQEQEIRRLQEERNHAKRNIVDLQQRLESPRMESVEVLKA
jgi:chromosome segregation ATPase